MTDKIIRLLILLFICSNSAACHRSLRTAKDITPANINYEKLDWRYGAQDIRTQTSKLLKQMMDRWFAKTCYNLLQGKPRLVITEINNKTGQYISTDMIKDIFECSAIEDGRFNILVGDYNDKQELDYFMQRILTDPKHCNNLGLLPNRAIAPQFLVKVKISNAVTSDRFYDYEDYQMTLTLYDIETQEAIDSLSDVINKKIRR